MNPILRRVLIGLAIAVGLGVAGLTVYLGSALQGLPSVEELRDYEPPVTTRVHAGDGALVAEFASEHRVFVPIEAIPDSVKNAFLSAEDAAFYAHSGVDMRALTRAMVSNVGNVLRGRRLEGASTITQQVAGNMLTGRDRTLRRKIREAILAMRLEQAFQGDREARKNRVLELYLNQIYLGQRAYGVAAAALNYFNKSLDELTLAEAAYLAALPKAPNNYNPVRQRDRAEARRNWVLERMVRNDYITQQQAETARAEPLVAVDRLQGEQYVAATHFVEEVRRELVRTMGDAEVNEGGLSVRSTLDSRLQLLAAETLHAGLEAYDRRSGWRGPLSVGDASGDVQRQIQEALAPPALTGWRRAMVTDTSRGVTVTLEGGATARLADADVRWAAQGANTDRARALRAGVIVYAEPGSGQNARTASLRQTPQIQGALVAMDPNTGRVLAMIGGYDVAGRGYNRATQAQRQPGSSIKPIVYAAALEFTGAMDPVTGVSRPITPATLIPDDPFAVAAGDGSIWRPENYNRTFNGPTTMRRGLEQSRNAMTARMAYEMGIERVVQYGQRFGVYGQTVQPVFALALGAGETTLLRLTTAYAMFANGGRRVSPVFIDRVQDRYGRSLEVADRRACSECSVPWHRGIRPPVLPDDREQVIDPITAYQVTTMLEGVVQRGTATLVRSVGAPLAGKTGTTNDYRDAWFVGYAPDLVVGVWAGFDEPRNMGEGETGGRISAPIFRDFMQRALRPEGASDITAVPFRIPRGVALVRVDAQTGGVPTPETTAMILESFRPGTEPSLDAVGPQFVFGAGEPADPEVLESLGVAGAPGESPDAASYSLGPPDGLEVSADAAASASAGAPMAARTTGNDDFGQLY